MKKEKAAIAKIRNGESPNRSDGAAQNGGSSARLVPRNLLDSRPADVATRTPIADSVNIPFAELPGRTHELPPREREILIAGLDEAAGRTQAWLTSNGRLARTTSDFRFEIASLNSKGADIGRLWQPAGFLEQVAGRIPRGTVLDLACGSGRESVYLASLGFDVTGVDLLPDALDKARDLAARCAAAIRPIQFRRIDLESDGELNGAFDQRFDLIVCFRYLHRPLLARFREWLNPGGFVIYETFTTLHRERHGKPARDAFVLRPGELRDLLGELEILEYAEDWHDAAHTACALARASF